MKIIVITTALTLAACGFHPAYQKGVHSDAIQEKLVAIEVMPVGGKMGQELRNSVRDILNPNDMHVPARYRLAMTLQKNIVPAAVERDRRITRYNVSIIVPYTVTLIEKNTVIDKGTLKVTGSYDALDSRFSTFIAEDKTTNNTIREAAEELVGRLGTSVIAKGH